MKQRLIKSCALLLLVVLCACDRSPAARRAKFLARGDAFLQEHEYSRAILEYRNALQGKRPDADVYSRFGLVYIAMQEYTSAVTAFRKAIQLDPKHFEAQLRLAQIYALTDDPETLKEAEGRLQALVEGGTDTLLEALNTLAFTEMKLGHADVAMQGFERVLAQSPGALSPSLLLAGAKILQKDTKGAEQVLQNACGNPPKSADGCKALAEFYIDQNRMSDAEVQLRRASQLDPRTALF